MENFDSILSPTSSLLLCKENLSSLDNEDEGILVDDYDDEYIQALLDREIASGGLQTQVYLQNSLIQELRLEGVQYILRTGQVFGFGQRTACLSVAYLDIFLSKRSIDVEKPWAIKLLSMACLSLAAKMEETIVPALSEFCVESYSFASSLILKMELLVLRTLDWEMGSITPFAFIDFFANKFCVPTCSFSRTGEIILGATRDAKIMCHKPSVIAAAAALAVLDHGLPRDALEQKISPLISTHSFQIESIISCYSLLQELDVVRLKLSQGIRTPDLSPVQLLPNGSSSVSSTKRRLVFNQTDEFGDVPDETKRKALNKFK